MAKSALIVQVKEGETVWIGDTELKIKEIRGKRIDLLFLADRSVKIIRDSLIKREETGQLQKSSSKE